ncbi:MULTISPECIES: hypothetical protein [Streptomyces]|uniref:Lipoprotein n=1 Tax=Streptomyces caniscabiei TaxID=2746961 RepID=A0ABU4MPN9_9ACTN|nr:MULTISPECIES: hypothetical protein [Streptomyces]MBE4739298.1 hypothetical protein [Streptomyces caniscabiei]MBE4758681.1 hypothetical protein [Streptomyces caniscabiei]MBE4771769.1 hypothetical protein [Streptomyces caniscabiei]MBE4787830.1 hypothetical protein [Streptomyces caniscabiei]MBE4797052.1 hypothetical protein [Streptomyces caniscabiei]
MHRPTTTATLLVTVAVSALTGCVTAHDPPPPPTSPVPSRPTEPRPEGITETQIVEAPAREALELVGPPREPTPSAPPEPKRATSAPPPPAGAAPTPAAPPPPRDARTAPRERPGPPPGSRRPHVEIPPLPRTVPTPPPKNSDVCALGHRYGGWGKDTPQAAICKDVYGR